MNFYTFHQNNSHGIMVDDELLGEFVIIEAENAMTANLVAESLGIYFGEVNTGKDCKCCGSRWHTIGEEDARSSPMIYGTALVEYVKAYPNESVRVHYANGNIKRY